MIVQFSNVFCHLALATFVVELFTGVSNHMAAEHTVLHYQQRNQRNRRYQMNTRQSEFTCFGIQSDCVCGYAPLCAVHCFADTAGRSWSAPLSAVVSADV